MNENSFNQMSGDADGHGTFSGDKRYILDVLFLFIIDVNQVIIRQKTIGKYI